MPITPDLPFPKSSGDAIRSKDWNDLVTETQRLDNAKVNRSGDTITGTLTIAGALGIGTATPSVALEIDKGATNDVALMVTSSGQGWGSGLALQNTAAGAGTFGLYSGQDGSLHVADVTKNVDRLTIDATGIAQFSQRATVGPVSSYPAVTSVGRLEVSGPSAEISLIRRELTAWPATPAAGDRFSWYNSNGVARLWGEVKGDLLAVQGDGKVGIGTTSPGYLLDVAGRMRVRDEGGGITAGIWFSGYGISDRAFAGLNNDNLIGFYGNSPGTAGWRLLVNITTGDLTISGNALKPGGGPWAAASDIRLKQNVKPLEGALDRLLRLRGTIYEWKDPGKHGNLTGQQVGFIGQDVEQVFPEWIGDDSNGYKVLSIRGFEAMTVESFRELKAECLALKQQVEKLLAEKNLQP
jgi:Chaperone of endosialidase